MAARLAEAETLGRLRRNIAPPVGLDFATNDYLGLRTYPEVVEAVANAARDHGAGAGASRLLGGDLPVLRELEAELARLKGTEAALLFPSGYQANVALLSTIAGEGDGIWSDSLNHASIIDGCRLSRAAVRVFEHNSVADLEASLSQHRASVRVALVVAEGVFSMDGDLCLLPQLRELCARHGARLIVDDAHATGVLGPQGQGVHAHYGLNTACDIVVGTLSKALGSQGAFVCGSLELREYLVNFARGYIFSTGLAPTAAAGALAAIAAIETDASLIQRLRCNINALASLLGSMSIQADNSTPIFPIVLGSEGRAVSAARRMASDGVFVGAVRPPAVPEGTSRLRITVSARHRQEDIARLASSLTTALETVAQ
jgi:8-amino-7-oxononanoate synthase